MVGEVRHCFVFAVMVIQREVLAEGTIGQGNTDITVTLSINNRRIGRKVKHRLVLKMLFWTH